MTNNIDLHHLFDPKLALGEWMTATLHEDGRFHAVWHKHNEIIQIDPIEAHQEDMHESHYKTLATHAVHRMVVFKHSDLIDLDQHQCTAVDHTTGQILEQKHRKEQKEKEKQKQEEEVFTLTIGRKGNSASSTARKLQQLQLWSNCWSDQNTGRTLKIGVAVDYLYYNMYGSVPNVQTQISSIWSSVNPIYIQTFNVQHIIASTVINQAPDGGATWNANGYRDTHDAGTMLNDFTAW
jgi:hypothetical protein